MKKLLVLMPIAALMCGFISCASLVDLNYPEPAFDKPYSYVIDASLARGDYEDNIRVYNKSSDSDIGFKVYVHSPKTNEWVLYGIASLKGIGDTNLIDTEMKGIENYRYFAIESLNGKNYKYYFYEDRDDLIIDILNY
jgi:hypothetical protein